MKNISVVLIEDHDLTRMGLKTAINSHDGLTVIGEATNAIQGLEILKTMKPDVAVVDIGLPQIDGIHLTSKFKKYQTEAGHPNTKILILTMNDSEDTVLAAFAAGADSYYMKDTSSDKLNEAIESTYAGNAWIDPAIANIVLKKINSGLPMETVPSEQPKTVEIEAISPEDEKVLETYPLTERELEILELIVDGCSNGEISKRLYITVGTVKTHVRNILNKLCVDDRTQAAVRALRSGLVD
ncbi:MAG: response regulator transcription factor [Sphaerospermopsis sp. SIO1G2]|nr:response regulator transcription factor [Sphaerospermopsis sp. SIO1G1]NET74520.1 response regulator transcription factor [Sphaerospermopsis sp. SIO1G2]